MSMLPLYRSHHNTGVCPYFSTNWPGNYGGGHELDHFFDNFNQIQLRDHVGKLTMDKDGGFTYQLDASGFQPNELTVNVEADQVVIHGKHTEQNQGESVERFFTRRVAIPNGIQKETIKCSLDEKGRMVVCGTQTAIEQGKQRTIPIEYKPAGKPCANNGRATKH